MPLAAAAVCVGMLTSSLFSNGKNSHQAQFGEMLVVICPSDASWCSPVCVGVGALSGRPELLRAWLQVRPVPGLPGPEVWREAKRNEVGDPYSPAHTTQPARGPPRCLLAGCSGSGVPQRLPPENWGALSTHLCTMEGKRLSFTDWEVGKVQITCTRFQAWLLTAYEATALFQVQFSHVTH